MDLRNKYILVKIKDTKEFQKKVFLKGVIWNSGDIDVRAFRGDAENHIAFFISNDKYMTFGLFGAKSAEQIIKEIEARYMENYKFIIYDDNKLEDKKIMEVE